MKKLITLSHGSGGRIAHNFIQDVFVSHFGPEVAQHDQARLSFSDHGCSRNDAPKIAMSTDTFVISPRKFPGGDIGCLSVYGTVNDLVVGGAVPKYLSCAFVIEEGFEIDELEDICQSMAAAAKRCGLTIVTGDTKVVPKGHCEGLFINTTGIGFISPDINLDFAQIEEGDVILVSGDIGRHGACVATQRESYGLSLDIASDCGPLNQVAQTLVELGVVKYMRDATRGGVAAVLNEIAEACGHKFCLDEQSLPVSEAVESFCDVLGFNPLHLANEGCLVAIVRADAAERAITLLRDLPESSGAAVIGSVVDKFESSSVNSGYVTLKSVLGAETILASPAGELLPRIC